jgi:UDP-N-acetylglucosamine--N-acetylmuramyl-(pentapeptide) pyrophosphoryl-undecaprenol N-acetylglucosamine transferase
VREAIVLAAGGTGGHLFPAEAVARQLLARGRTVHLLTDRRAGSLAERVPGIAVAIVRAGRLGGGAARFAWGLTETAIGIVQARRVLRRLVPSAVIGFGGYTSVPTMVAASQLGLPSLIHEQNAVCGRANRLLSARIGQIATGFPSVAGLRAGAAQRTVYTGNPVRAAFLAPGEAPYAPPGESGEIALVILGGSQGARIFAEIVPQALALLGAAERARLRVSQQARPEDLDRVRAAYRASGIAAEIEPFFTDVPARLGRAHLAICRAGASTLAELAALGRPAVLVPYPHATDDHQSANAAAFAAAGGGWVVAQPEFTAAGFALRLAGLLAAPSLLAEAASRAAGFGRRDAVDRLVGLVLALSAGTRPQERAA